MPICRPNIHDFHQNSEPLLSINRYLFTCAKSEFIIDFEIISLEVGRCSGQLHRRRTSDGPFHCTHGVALTLFAETVAGLAVFSRLGPKGKGILRKTETEYVKKAKGTKGRKIPAYFR
jgi:acyl-coenzyme A thioesterase PaaI-like protein